MSEIVDPDALVVRVTMNPRLRRAAFGLAAMNLLWCLVAVATMVWIASTLPGSVGALAACALVVGWCSWVAWRVVRAERGKHRALTMGVPTLQLDGLGVHVRDVPMHLDGASLAWADCAAVVVSSPPKGREWPVQPTRYVQFLPAAEDRVSFARSLPRARDVRVGLLGLTPVTASLTWLELPGVRPDADDVVSWLGTHRPGTRVVGARHSVTDE